MKQSDLESQVLQSEWACSGWLMGVGLFNPSNRKCRGIKARTCTGVMKVHARKLRDGDFIPEWKCNKNSCRTTRSVRSTNSFFTYKSGKKTGNSRLSLCQIVRLVYTWLYTASTHRQMCLITGLSGNTIVDWLHFCRNVCSAVLENAEKMKGTPENPVEIDESYHVGRRKYNRGRMHLGDKLKKKNDEEASSSTPPTDSAGAKGGAPADEDEGVDEDASGPWVFGACLTSDFVRFRLVDDRKATTLIPIIKDWVAAGSTICSDEWRAYSRLAESGFEHRTVCHKREFVNATGFHTQTIERMWVESKAYLRRARGGGKMLQSHLDEISWRRLRASHKGGLLVAFFEDVNRYLAVQ